MDQVVAEEDPFSSLLLLVEVEEVASVVVEGLVEGLVVAVAADLVVVAPEEVGSHL